MPIEREIGTDSVQASWRLLGLNRPFGDEWSLDDLPFEKLAATGFGMRLDTPVDIYQRSERSVKYGSLFIALTFVTLFLFEVTGGRPLVVPGDRVVRYVDVCDGQDAVCCRHGVFGHRSGDVSANYGCIL